jgi:hypothetical protein
MLGTDGNKGKVDRIAVRVALEKHLRWSNMDAKRQFVEQMRCMLVDADVRNARKLIG